MRHVGGRHCSQIDNWTWNLSTHGQTKMQLSFCFIYSLCQHAAWNWIIGPLSLFLSFFSSTSNKTTITLCSCGMPNPYFWSLESLSIYIACCGPNKKICVEILVFQFLQRILLSFFLSLRERVKEFHFLADSLRLFLDKLGPVGRHPCPACKQEV